MASSSVAHTPSTSTPASVLTFWFGSAWESNRASLNKAAYFDAETNARWYGGKADVDAQCRTFAPLIDAAASGTLDWQVSYIYWIHSYL